MSGHPVQVRRVGLDGDQRQQGVDGVLDRADQRHVDGHPAADLLTAHIDLDHRHVMRVERAVGEVGAEQEQRVAVLHRPVARAEADQPGHPHVKPVVVLDGLWPDTAPAESNLVRAADRAQMHRSITK